MSEFRSSCYWGPHRERRAYARYVSDGLCLRATIWTGWPRTGNTPAKFSIVSATGISAINPSTSGWCADRAQGPLAGSHGADTVGRSGALHRPSCKNYPQRFGGTATLEIPREVPPLRSYAFYRSKVTGDTLDQFMDIERLESAAPLVAHSAKFFARSNVGLYALRYVTVASLRRVLRSAVLPCHGVAKAILLTREKSRHAIGKFLYSAKKSRERTQPQCQRQRPVKQPPDWARTVHTDRFARRAPSLSGQ